MSNSMEIDASRAKFVLTNDRAKKVLYEFELCEWSLVDATLTRKVRNNLNLISPLSFEPVPEGVDSSPFFFFAVMVAVIF